MCLCIGFLEEWVELFCACNSYLIGMCYIFSFEFDFFLLILSFKRSILEILESWKQEWIFSAYIQSGFQPLHCALWGGVHHFTHLSSTPGWFLTSPSNLLQWTSSFRSFMDGLRNSLDQEQTCCVLVFVNPLFFLQNGRTVFTLPRRAGALLCPCDQSHLAFSFLIA